MNDGEPVIACKCQVKGCPKSARWQIGFRIWPVGMKSRLPHNSIEGLSGALVCDEHAVRDPAQFFTPRGKERITMGFLREGKGMPDFATAQIIHNEIAGGAPIDRSEAAQLGGVSA